MLAPAKDIHSAQPGPLTVAVLEIAGRSARAGGRLLSLPIVSSVAFVMTWQAQREMAAITGLGRGTLILVPLCLPFFVPFALASKTGLSFWPSFFVEILLAVQWS